MPHAAGFTDISIQVANEQQFTTDAEASFAQAWANGSRFHVQLAPDEIAQVKAQYVERFRQLVRKQAGTTTMSNTC
jgi:hypothetical protein